MSNFLMFNQVTRPGNFNILVLNICLHDGLNKYITEQA